MNQRYCRNNCGWHPTPESDARLFEVLADPVPSSATSALSQESKGAPTAMKQTPIQDWYISLQPRDPRAQVDGGAGHLEVLRGTEEDAIASLELYAELIRSSDHVPDGMDWRNRSFASVVRRWGKRTFLVRVDCFEVETDNGMTQGHGWLRAHPA